MSPSPRFMTSQVAKPKNKVEDEISPSGGLKRALSGIGKKGTEIIEKGVEKGSELKGQAVEIIEAGQDGVKRTISDIGKKGSVIFEKGVEKGTELKGQAVDIIEAGQARVWQEASLAAAYTKEKTTEMKELASERRMQVAVAFGAGGAVIVGTPCAAGGLVVGGTIGIIVGILPALFTMGLSIPFGAAIGAGCGAAMGGSVGGAVGFSGCSFLGYKVYAKRSAIRRFWIRSVNKTKMAVRRAKDRVVYRVRFAKGCVRERMYEARLLVATLAGYSKAKVIIAVKDEDVRSGAACAVGGGMVLGAGGAAAGAATGGLLGAVVGLPAAIVTLGLSVPFCAVVGGGLGLATGATVGGTAGTVGGAGSYYAWARREAIRAWSACMAEKVRQAGGDLQEGARQSVNELQEKAWQSANDLRQSAKELQERARQSASGIQARVHEQFSPAKKST